MVVINKKVVILLLLSLFLWSCKNYDHKIESSVLILGMTKDFNFVDITVVYEFSIDTKDNKNPNLENYVEFQENILIGHINSSIEVLIMDTTTNYTSDEVVIILGESNSQNDFITLIKVQIKDDEVLKDVNFSKLEINYKIPN